MALTETQWIDKVKRLARERGFELAGDDIREALPTALKQLAVLSLSADWRPLLENDYALTIAVRSASFAAQTDLLPESIKVCDHIVHTGVIVPGGAVPLPFRILERVTDLDFAGAVPQTLFAFAAVGLSAVEFRYSSALAGTLTVRAVKIPTIATVPLQLEDLLIEIGIQMSPQRAAA